MVSFKEMVPLAADEWREEILQRPLNSQSSIHLIYMISKSTFLLGLIGIIVGSLQLQIEIVINYIIKLSACIKILNVEEVYLIYKF